jgi:hypothetical protein
MPGTRLNYVQEGLNVKDFASVVRLDRYALPEWPGIVRAVSIIEALVRDDAALGGAAFELWENTELDPAACVAMARERLASKLSRG